MRILKSFMNLGMYALTVAMVLVFMLVLARSVLVIAILGANDIAAKEIDKISVGAGGVTGIGTGNGVPDSSVSITGLAELNRIYDSALSQIPTG